MNNSVNHRSMEIMSRKIGSLVLFDVLELSKKLNITPTTIRSYMKSGRLQGRKVGGKWFISEDSLKDFFSPKPSTKESGG